jgi:predicted nuclease of restriction endonuclease-like (RecB) superfamily
MRSFFLAYRDRAQIVQTLSGQSSGRSGSPTSPVIVQTVSGQSSPRKRPFSLGWSHYVFLLGIKNPDERSFYEIEATAGNRTLRELKRQFDTSLYERLALSRDKAGIRKLAKKGQLVEKPQDILKEPLVLEFLGLPEQARYSESDLEGAVISQIERFLLEMGKGFLFEARQKRFRDEGAERMSGAVGHKRVAKDFIERYPIPIPPLPEQRRIVGILDEAFEGIATAKANAEKNLQNARALFRKPPAGCRL